MSLYDKMPVNNLVGWVKPQGVWPKTLYGKPSVFYSSWTVMNEVHGQIFVDVAEMSWIFGPKKLSLNISYKQNT